MAETTSEADAAAIVDTYVGKLREGEAREGGHFDLEVATRFVLSLRPASRDVFRQRLATCLDCDRAKLIVNSDTAIGMKLIQCLECQCLMNAKARFIGAECPLGKFGPEDLVRDGI